ncbi:MAG: M28 family peptidase [Gemmatimonadota bacterium]|nr:M28 family peptidase [Gemmatimonadota bacterium]
MPRTSSRANFGAAALVLTLLSCAPSSPAPGTAAPADTDAAVTAADLRARLGIFADDSMMGRAAGTLGNVRGTAYLAGEARRLGLTPAGEHGTFFQTVPLVARTLARGVGIRAGSTAFAPYTDFIPRDQGKGARDLDGVPVVDGGVYGDSTRPPLSPEQAADRLVVVRVAPDSNGSPAGTVNRAVVTAQFATAAGIAVATLDAIGPQEREELRAPGAELAQPSDTEAPAFMYVSARMAQELLRAGIARGSIAFADSPAPAPARNVVAILPGSDPALRGELVAIGAHNDHEGIAPTPQDHDSLRAWNRVMRPGGAENSPGQPTTEQSARIRAILDSLRRANRPRRDSIFNGADDDGSGAVGVLEIAEALARSPNRPKRSILFVWHTAEELGLLGADWFTRHPTVPRDSIVAQLNIDMIGRGGPGDLPGGGPAYLQLIGSRRLSTELGDLVERVNTQGRHGFAFNYDWDTDGHPDNSYCRSDHYMYARYGIPVTFFTTGGHLDYHQLTDEIAYEDYDKMARVAGLIEGVARSVADLDHRVLVDKPKPDPEGTCKQ